MWNSKPAKVIRWIIYLPLVALCLILISSLFMWTVTVGVSFLFSSWWKLLLLIIFSGLCWALIRSISMYLSFFVVAVCPNKLIGSIAMAVVATAIFGILLYKMWSVQDDYPIKLIVLCVIISILVIKLWYNILFASTLSIRNSPEAPLL